MKRRLTTLFVSVGLLVLCPTTIAHAETRTTESTTQVQSESQEKSEDFLEDMSDADILGIVLLALLVAFGMAKLVDENKKQHPPY